MLFLYLMSIVMIKLLLEAESLKHVEEWIEMFRENKGEKTVSLICGNKSDLEKYLLK